MPLRDVTDRVNQVRARNESAWLLPNDGTRTNHRLRLDMPRFADTDELDLVIVGCGAGGSVLLQRLARAGWRVAALDAGPFWDPDTDWVSDEAGSHQLYWTEPRVIAGTDPVPMGSNNSGRGVGGSMVHYAGYTPRFHPSDFRTYSADGVGADWPLDYAELRPYYADLEQELPVAGEHWPWGDPHGYPHRPHPVGGNGEVFLRGADKLGITAKVGPVAIANGRFGNRPHCIYRGFCLQGCKVNAKASPLITHIPDALAHGAEVRPDTMVTQVAIDERTGRAPGRALRQRRPGAFPAGQDGGHRRLLDRNAAAAAQLGVQPFPRRPVQRLRPGRTLPHGAGRAADRGPLRRRGADVQGAAARGQHRGVLRDRPGQGLQARLLHPDGLAAADHLGRACRGARALGSRAARVHERLRALVLPRARCASSCRSRRTGSRWRRRRTVTACRWPASPTPSATTTGPWPKAAQQVMEDILHAAGADEVITIQRYAHLVGGARMAKDERHGVVDRAAAVSRSPTCTSPTAACCPPRAAPTRP